MNDWDESERTPEEARADNARIREQEAKELEQKSIIQFAIIGAVAGGVAADWRGTGGIGMLLTIALFAGAGVVIPLALDNSPIPPGLGLIIIFGMLFGGCYVVGSTG